MTTYHLSSVLAKNDSEVNLDKFYAVQQYSGAAVTIFKSQEDAAAARAEWISALQSRFEKGDSEVMDFSLDSDLHGGCVQTCLIASHLWPGPICEVLPWEASHSTYQDCDGSSLVSWGSPALQRPRR